MSKREIPVDANENTKFAIIMSDLLNGHELKEPKDGSYDEKLGTAKWKFFKEKSDGVMNGFFAKKASDPSLPKSQNVWLYKACIDGDTRCYLFESFGEIVGYELFRYHLGSLVPKNRMTQIPGKPPGIVSKCLPNFFTLTEKLTQLPDTESRLEFVKNIPHQRCLPKIIATSCFFNDFDGKLSNIGTMINQIGIHHSARIDFACSLSNLHNHTYGIGLYLFNDGEYSNLFNHAATYHSLIFSDEFKNAIIELSQINIDHVSLIVQAAVKRFVQAWRNIPLESNSITRFYKHLYGADQSTWPTSYSSEYPKFLNYDLFEIEIIDNIVSAISERKIIFAFFAQALTMQQDLKKLIHYGEDPSDQHHRKICNNLINQAKLSSAKQYILDNLTKDIEIPTPDFTRLISSGVC